MPDSSRPKRPRVIVTRQLMPAVEARMAELFDVALSAHDHAFTKDELKAAVADCDVLVPTVTDEIDAEIIGAAGDRLKLIANFVRHVCGCSGDWTMAAYREEMIEKIRTQVGDAKVICALSGGVDSSVAAALIHEAIGENLTCVFVDHGLLRMNEREQVERLFRDHYNIPLVVVDAEQRFMAGLSGVTDPEKKRKFIGAEFINVFEEEAKKIGGADFLAQGTLYPDGTVQGRGPPARQGARPPRHLRWPPPLPRPRPRDPHPRGGVEGAL